MCINHCSNQTRDSNDLDDWSEGPCGENPGELKERIRQLQIVVDAAYKWRAAEIYLAALVSGLRLSDEEEAVTKAGDTLRQLRIETDILHRRDKQR